MAILAHNATIAQGFPYSLQAAAHANQLARQKLAAPGTALNQVIATLNPVVRIPILASWGPFIASGSRSVDLIAREFDPLLDLLTPAAQKELDQCKASALHRVLTSGPLLTAAIQQFIDQP